MADSVFISFPGVDYPLAASFALGHGISPSSGTLEMIPQYGSSSVQQNGDLVLGLGSNRVTIHGCRVASATSRMTASGRTITLQIQDRRWKWAFGAVFGRYNVRRPDNSIDPASERTPQELATILFKAMGEPVYSVGDLPNDPRPEVEWEGDNPAEELQDLAESLGCRVVLQLDNTVAIRRSGDGSQLPGGAQTKEGFGIDPADRPESLLFISGPVRFQQALLLEAVGEDTDGSIKTINNLSYAPAGGWSKESPYYLLMNETDKKKRALAEKTVFKWYRIKDELEAPEYPEVNRLKDILPVDDFLVVTKTDNNGVKVPRKAYIYGDFWEANPGQTANSSSVEYKGSWSLDRDRGIVQLGDFAIKLDATTGTVSPAILHLVCSYHGRDSRTREMVRWVRERAVSGGNPGTGPEVVKQEDVLPTVERLYNPTTLSPTGTKNNVTTEVSPQANYYLNAAEAKYQNLQTDEREYPGILAINPDGAIQQVSWSVQTGESGGARTQASRNTEHSPYTLPYKEADRIKKAAALKKQQQKLAAQQRRSRGGAP